MGAVIFDLDGTILDTLEDLTDSMNFALASLGQPPRSSAQVRHMVGDGVRNFALRALPSDRTDLLEEVLELMRNRYRENWHVKTRPYDGVEELLAELCRRGLETAVVTNKDQAMARRMVDRYFPGIFAEVVGVEGSQPVKPDPHAVNKLIERRKWDKKAVMLVGDSGVDIDTARAAAVAAVGVSWGFRGLEELRKHGAGFIIDRPQELLALLP